MYTLLHTLMHSCTFIHVSICTFIITGVLAIEFNWRLSMIKLTLTEKYQQQVKETRSTPENLRKCVMLRKV